MRYLDEAADRLFEDLCEWLGSRDTENVSLFSVLGAAHQRALKLLTEEGIFTERLRHAIATRAVAGLAVRYIHFRDGPSVVDELFERLEANWYEHNRTHPPRWPAEHWCRQALELLRGARDLLFAEGTSDFVMQLLEEQLTPERSRMKLPPRMDCPACGYARAKRRGLCSACGWP